MSSDFLEAAAGIGQRIVDDAIWDSDRCSWVGAVDDKTEPWNASYRALGSSLYDGTAGVGLFLAHLVDATGSAAARRTSLGALRHAVAHPDPREGFHAGALGIAWTAARVAELLDDEELHQAARAVPTPDPDGCPDVLLGAAGSLIARVALVEALGAPGLIDDAVVAGEALLAAATVTPHGWSWAGDQRQRRHLCGLSHGAAGIGWALLELHAATGDERFREAGAGAFAYERSWLNRETGTWPDLRIGGQRRGSCVPSPAIATWCHGEAGIALTRLRAAELLSSEEFADEAEIALETTTRELAASLPYEFRDVTLCHGLSGAAEVLLCASGDTAGLTEELGRATLERYDPHSRSWPCGTTTGTTPALFQGLSGIGWWYLRLADPTTPSPLTLPIKLTALRAAA